MYTVEIRLFDDSPSSALDIKFFLRRSAIAEAQRWEAWDFQSEVRKTRTGQLVWRSGEFF